MDSITGKWIGKYIYGDNYDEEYKGKSVSFEMELFFDGDMIRGTCTDDETKELFTAPSKIEGTFDNDTILFYKTYPVPKGLVGGSLLIAREFSFASIQYSGVLKKTFFLRTPYFRGTWEVNGSFLDTNCVANYYTRDGRWEMKRT